MKDLLPKPTEEEVQKEEEERDSYKPYEEPGWNAQPFGQWHTVRDSKPETFVDLQLPKVELDIPYVPAANVPIEPPVKKFKEKSVSSLDDASYSNISDSFKKRKTAIKRNARQRLDDD